MLFWQGECSLLAAINAFPFSTKHKILGLKVVVLTKTHFVAVGLNLCYQMLIEIGKIQAEYNVYMMFILHWWHVPLVSKSSLSLLALLLLLVCCFLWSKGDHWSSSLSIWNVLGWIYGAGYMGHPMKLKLTINGLIVLLVNHYTKWGTQAHKFLIWHKK